MKPFDRRFLLGKKGAIKPYFYALNDASTDLAENINQPQIAHPEMSLAQVESTMSEVAGFPREVSSTQPKDTTQWMKGEVHAAAGDVRTKAGDAMDHVREWVEDRPLKAVLIGASIAFLLGRLTANRS